MGHGVGSLVLAPALEDGLVAGDGSADFSSIGIVAVKTIEKQRESPTGDVLGFPAELDLGIFPEPPSSTGSDDRGLLPTRTP